MQTNKLKSRFDTRLPKEQKMLFEKAARLGGYRSLTDFVILTVQQKAKEIIDEREKILATERDNEIFFEALINPPKPDKKLVSAAEEYNAMLAK